MWKTVVKAKKEKRSKKERNRRPDGKVENAGAFTTFP
jgi:hypothetical protein